MVLLMDFRTVFCGLKQVEKHARKKCDQRHGNGINTIPHALRRFVVMDVLTDGSDEVILR